MSRPTEQLSSVTEMTILKHPQGTSTMAAYQQPSRSKFMIHDILGSTGSGKLANDDRMPSPQPKDFSIFLNSIPEHDDESDCDSSKSCLIFYAFLKPSANKFDPVFSFNIMLIYINMQYVKKIINC